jgi:molybdopterin-guanine dinucleotide biosynthesis protein A
VIDALITAGGRLTPSDARAYGTDIKALVRIGGRTVLDAIVGALRGVSAVGRIVVVGPRDAAASAAPVDEWIDEFPTGEQNLLAALRAGRTDRVVMTASDLPFVTSASYSDLIARSDDSIDAAYPIFRRDEFLHAYPAGRASFARLADGEWTGGSAFVLNRKPLLRNEKLLQVAFGARKSLSSLAALLGPGLLIRYALGRVRVEDVEQRASALLQAKVKAVTGADPALAMDCDDAGDFDYARAESAP